VPAREAVGLRAAAFPLYMSDPDKARTLAEHTLALAESVTRSAGSPEHVS
jgi:hypothetical protein